MTRGSWRIASGVPSAIFSPKCSTATRSEIPITTDMSCSISSRVSPRSRTTLRMRAVASRVSPGRQCRAVFAPEADAPRVRREEPRDDVEEGGLAGAVRPDHREDLAGLDAEAHARQRGQRPEPLGDVVDLEDHAVARSREKIRRSPSRPRGMKRTMTMRTTPMTMKYQSTMDETLSRRIVKKTPPMIGPTRVPRPPIMTEMMNSPDSVHSIRSGVAKAERIG